MGHLHGVGGDAVNSQIDSERPLTFARKAATSALLCALFFIVYGGTNYFTSLRHDVGTWVYPWERHIPFIPLMIIPYMSIDLFFVAGPLICSDRRELSLLARRIALAIIVCGAFFLAMPLKFSFERPPVTGVLGIVFDHFRSMDQPFNQFPSLHIALQMILVDLYGRHTRGPLRHAVWIWFTLIAASTLLVYQHHVADVVGGFILGALSFYAFGDASWRSAVSRNRRMGVIYGTSAIVWGAAGFWLRPWGLILLWPAAGFAAAAIGYFWIGPSIYRKSAGRVPLSTRVLLGPILGAQWMSHRHYARRSRAWDAATDRVWIGRALSHREGEAAVAQGVVAVVDLTSEFSECDAFRNLHYLNIPILDLTAPLDHHLDDAVRFIERHCRSGIVYVHCKAGYSRSAAVVAAYLLRSGTVASADEAVALLKAARSRIIIRPEALDAIRSFAPASPPLSPSSGTPGEGRGGGCP